MLKRIWTRWKTIATEIGNFQARLILSLLYFVVVTPFGLAVRFLSDPLRVKYRRGSTHWQAKEMPDSTLDRARSQF